MPMRSTDHACMLPCLPGYYSHAPGIAMQSGPCAAGADKVEL